MTARRQAATLTLSFALLALVTGWLVLPAAPAGFYWDDAWYLWMAEWFSGRESLRDVALAMMHARQYPPLLPQLASILGAGPDNPAPALLLNAVAMGVAGAIMVRWLITTGLGLATALLLALFLALNPVALMFLPGALSEPLFMALSVAALALAAGDRQGVERWILIGLLAGLAVATRSAGWALVLALLIPLVLGRRTDLLGRYLAAVAAALLVKGLLTSGLPETPSQWAVFAETFTSLNPAYIGSQLSGLGHGWLELWGSTAGMILASLAIAPGLVMRLRALRPDAVYVAISLAMLLLWPYPDHMGRFLWALLPVLLICAAEPLKFLPEDGNVRRLRPILLTLAILLSLPNGAAHSVGRLMTPPGEGLEHLVSMQEWTRAADREAALMTLRVRLQMIEDALRIRELVPANACIYSEFSAAVSVHAQRAAFASPWNSLEQAGAFQGGCTYYYLAPDALGAGAESVQGFTAQHREFFRSVAPYAEDGARPLGILLELLPTDP